MAPDFRLGRVTSAARPAEPSPSKGGNFTKRWRQPIMFSDMPTRWRKWISQLASSRPVDDAKLELAREFGREAARLLYPTMQWDEARLTLAGVWDEKDLMPWSKARPAVHA